MIKNTRSLLKDVKKDKFDKVKVRDKFIGLLNFLKKLLKVK